LNKRKFVKLLKNLKTKILEKIICTNQRVKYLSQGENLNLVIENGDESLIPLEFYIIIYQSQFCEKIYKKIKV